MNEDEYRNAVIKMRKHQDDYFRFHQRNDLIEAKRLEKQIDAENERWKLEKDQRARELSRVNEMRQEALIDNADDVVPDLDA